HGRANLPSSPTAWDAIEQRVDRRRRRGRAAWLGAGSLIGAAVVAFVAWSALVLHSKHPVETPRAGRTLPISNVRVFAVRGFAKVGGTVRNSTNQAVGASVTCTLRDAVGRVVGTATGRVPFLLA